MRRPGRRPGRRVEEWPKTRSPVPTIADMVFDVRRQRSIFAIASLALVASLSGCHRDDSPPAAAGPTAQSPSTSAPTPTLTPTSTPTTSTPTLTGSPSPTPSIPAKVTQKNPGWALDRIDQHKRPLDKRFTTTGQGQGVT